MEFEEYGLGATGWTKGRKKCSTTAQSLNEPWAQQGENRMWSQNAAQHHSAATWSGEEKGMRSCSDFLLPFQFLVLQPLTELWGCNIKHVAFLWSLWSEVKAVALKCLRLTRWLYGSSICDVRLHFFFKALWEQDQRQQLHLMRQMFISFNIHYWNSKDVLEVHMRSHSLLKRNVKESEKV